MRIFAVDDEALARMLLCKAIRTAAPDAELEEFSDPQEVLRRAEEISCDVAFLDITMRSMTGLELAKRLLALHPNVNVIFATGYREYMGEAWDLMASGFITKPVTAEKVQTQLQNLRRPVTVSAYPVKEKRVQVQCFGNFEIFVDGMPLHFQYEKSRELLAYLVDRKGAECSTGEMCAVLWEDDRYHGAYFQQLRKDIIHVLQQADCAQILSTARGKLAIVPKEISCDYYDFLDGAPDGQKKFRGEYMTQYSWAEYMVPTLTETVRS